MVDQPGANLYTQGFGSRPEGVEVPVFLAVAPSTSDVNYPLGKTAIVPTANSVYSLTSFSSSAGIVTANWTALGGGTTALATLTGNSGGAISPTAGNINILGAGALSFAGSGSTLTGTITPGTALASTLTADSGGALSPTAGNFNLLGTANQITTTGSGSTITWSIPVAFTAPGSITATTTLTATLGDITATNGNISATGNLIASKSAAGADVTAQITNSDNTNGASRAGVEIATGGASSGDPYLSFQISGVGASTMTMGLDNSASDIFVISNSSAIGTSNALTLTQAGALTATTTLTATLGNITATSGNFVAVAAGTGLSLPVTTASGAASGTVNCNGRVGSVSFTGVSIAAAADLTLTMGNTSIAGASTRVQFSMSGATTGSALSVKSVTPSANQLVWVITNGTGATTTTADITFDFIVLN